MYEVLVLGLPRTTEAARRGRQRMRELRCRVQEERTVDCGGGAATGRDGDDGACAEWQGVGHGWSLRRDQRAAGRLLPDRGERPERRDPGGLEDPAGARGKR